MSMSARQNDCGEGGDGISAAAIAIRMAALALAVVLSGLIWFSPAARAAGRSVSGTVTDAATHAGLPAVAVTLYDSAGLAVATATSAADGTYALGDAPPGPYEVGFTDAGYVPQFYSGKSSLTAADPVEVTEGATTAGVDAALVAAPGQISGSVTDASTHAGLQKVTVTVYDSAGLAVATATSAADGTYALSDVPPGAYEVGFSGAGYVAQFYNGKSSLAVADPVSVAAGATTAGIDAALTASPGQISGSVTDASTHAGIEDVVVYAYDANGNLFSSASTAADGTYALAGLPPGLYRLGFASDGYLPQFYGGRASLAAADPVPVTAGATTAGIDAALVTATGQISGTATDASTAKPIEKIEVTVYDATGHPVNSACTRSDGTYTLSGLAPGSYRVGFNDNCGARIMSRSSTAAEPR
jgi:Carboxypeptidase regulatory-like domain